MKEKKNQYNKQYSNFQYRSRDISLFLLITRILGRKREQRTCSERFTRSSRIINRSRRGGSRRYDLSRRTQNHGSYSKVYPSPYTAREMIGEGKRSVVCMSRAGTGRHPLSTFHQHVGHSNPSKYDWLFERWPRSLDDRSL